MANADKIQALFDRLDAIVGYSTYIAPTNNKRLKFDYPCIVLMLDKESEYIKTSGGDAIPMKLDVEIFILDHLNDDTEQTKLDSIKTVVTGLELVRGSAKAQVSESRTYPHIENNVKLFIAELKGSI